MGDGRIHWYGPAPLHRLGPTSVVLADVVVIPPMKKPSGKALSPEQQQANREQALQRVVAEQAIGGVKIWGVVREVMRSGRHGLRDEVM